MRSFPIILVLILMMLTPTLALSDASKPVVPVEAEITEADQAAVGRLGQKNGALELVPDVLDLEGLVLGASGSALGLDQAISDLNGKVVGNLIILNLKADVLFDFDKAEIKPEAETELTKAALVIQKKAKGVVTIRGFTDSKGKEEYNKALSQSRAQAVLSWLRDKGGAKAKYKTEGLGEADPVAPNAHPDGSDNPEGRSKNRRVEIEIETQQGGGE